MKTRTCTCRDYEFNGTCEHLTPVPVENWEMEFHKIFECDCMLCEEEGHSFTTTAVHMKRFISNLLIKEREEAYKKGYIDGVLKDKKDI